MKIYYHADDLGMNLDQSLHFLTCHNEGVLNSLAVMTTSPNVDGCYALVKEAVGSGKIRPTVHLNFVEGPALSDKNELPDIVDERGYFSLGFVKAFFMGFSVGKKREAYKTQFKNEIRLQIKKGLELFRDNEGNIVNWGIDGHLHFHMIPIIWKSLCEVIAEEGFNPTWIRISKDPVYPVLATPSLWKKVSIINVAKWMILKMIGPRRRKVEKMGAKVPCFFGMFFTLHMEKDVVEKLLPKYEKVARKKGLDLELMFHPGYQENRELSLDPTRDDLWEANSSIFRVKEQETLKTI